MCASFILYIARELSTLELSTPLAVFGGYFLEGLREKLSLFELFTEGTVSEFGISSCLEHVVCPVGYRPITGSAIHAT